MVWGCQIGAAHPAVERLQPVYRASGPVVLNAAPVPGFEALREYRRGCHV